VSTNFAKPTPNIKMTSCCDVTNSVYPITLTTICQSTAKYWNFFRGHTVKQFSCSSPDLFMPLTEPHWKKCPWKNFKWFGNPRPGSGTVIYCNLKSKVTILKFQFVAFWTIKPSSLNGYRPARPLLKTYSSAACNVTLTHDKWVLGCTTIANNMRKLNLKP